MSKISIVTPSFNQGEFIEETILSVINQGYNNLEYIVIDGGSTDDSVGIIKKYEKHITYWISEKDKGQSHAINKGFQLATGEIVGWLNSDDLLEEGALERIASFFNREPELEVLFGQWQEFDSKGNRPKNFNPLEVSNVKWMYSSLYAQPSTFYRKDIFNKIGYLDESLKFSMDNDLFKRMILFGSKTKRTNEIFSKFRWHDQSKSSTLHEICRQDNKKIFITFLESYNNFSVIDKFIALLHELELYEKPNQKYIINIVFNREEILQMMAHNISFYAGRFYNEGKFEALNKIITFFETESAVLMLREAGLGRILNRVKYLGPSGIRILRKIKQLKA